MFRSPISPASFCTLATNSRRKTSSESLRVAAVETLRPGILIPKKPDQDADDKHGEGNANDAREDSSPNHPIFFRKRRAQTQKRIAAMPERMARECQYSKKSAPRRMMARINEMK